MLYENDEKLSVFLILFSVSWIYPDFFLNVKEVPRKNKSVDSSFINVAIFYPNLKDDRKSK